MLPKTRSIFHLEEEEMEEKWGDGENTQINRGFVAIKDGDGLVGLQILIQRKNDRLVITDTLDSSKKMFEVPAIRHVGFLKSCFLCGKELSLQKEVYMYRGDQGFCSAECRHKQILRDKRSEIDACRRLRRFRLHDRHQHHQHHLGSKVMKFNGRAKVSVAS